LGGTPYHFDSPPPHHLVSATAADTAARLLAAITRLHPRCQKQTDRQTASDSERERKVQRGTETHRQYPVCGNPTARRRERCSQRAQRTPSSPRFTSASGCISIIHDQQQQLTRLYVCQLDRISSLYNVHSTADDCW